jgi:hypothetical protein
MAPIGGQLGFARGGSFAFAASGFYDNAGPMDGASIGSPYFGDASHSTLAPTARKRLRTSATN